MTRERYTYRRNVQREIENCTRSARARCSMLTILAFPCSSDTDRRQRTVAGHSLSENLTLCLHDSFPWKSRNAEAATRSAGLDKRERTCRSSEPIIFNADEDRGPPRCEPWHEGHSITKRMRHLLLAARLKSLVIHRAYRGKLFSSSCSLASMPTSS